MRRLWLWLCLLVVLGIAAWFAIPPMWAWYHWRAAKADMDRYHSDEALVHLHAYLSVWPESIPAHLLACRAARRTGDFKEAKEQLQECQRLKDPPSPEMDLEDTLLTATMGDLDKNEEWLENWLSNHPAQAPLAWEALAAGYMRLYRVRDAYRCLDLWLKRQPDNTQALFLRGNLARQLGGAKRAAPDYRKVVELDPQRTEARRLLALCLLESGQFDEAAKHLDVLLREHPDDKELLARLARCQSKLGRLDAARQTLTKVLDDHPQYGIALRIRGQVALLEEHAAEAEMWLRRAVRALPHDYETSWALVQALRRQGKTAEASAQLQVAEDLKKRYERLEIIKSKEMSQNPRDLALQTEMGSLLIDLGHADVGRDWLLNALRLDPDYRPAHAALAAYYAAKGNTEQAQLHSQKARRAKAPISTP